jgi:ADP-ribose pyrophosphatase YjhB (NUDIX family)
MHLKGYPLSCDRVVHIMKFCSECGQPVALQWVGQEQRARYFCIACGTTHYQNPRVIVSCIICWQDQVLMCRRSHEPARGQWTFPSGFLECGETLEDGAVRETFEETGVVVDPRKLELYSVMNMTAIEQVAISFRISLTVKPAIRCGSECLEVVFMSPDDFPLVQFAWRESMGDIPQKLLDELRSGCFGIHLVSIGSKEGLGFRSREYEIKSRPTPAPVNCLDQLWR